MLWLKPETSDSSESELLTLHCRHREIDIFSQPLLVYCDTTGSLQPQQAAGKSDVTVAGSDKGRGETRGLS
jgi:hypothetical protein